MQASRLRQQARPVAPGGLRGVARPLSARCRGPLRCRAQQQQQQQSPAAPPLRPTAPEPKQPPPVPPPAPLSLAAQQQQPPGLVPSRPPAAPPVSVPISGPPGAAPAEVRSLQHPADVAAVAPASIVEVASPATLAIGKREAREQVAALAQARAEIQRSKADAEELRLQNSGLKAHVTEVMAQRDEAVVIASELLAGYKAMEAQLAATQQKLATTEGAFSHLTQELLDFREGLEGTVGPIISGGGGAGARGGGGGSKAEVTAEQLALMSRQMARDAERDGLALEQMKEEVLAPGSNGAAKGNGGGAAASNGGGSGNGTAAGNGNGMHPMATKGAGANVSSAA